MGDVHGNFKALEQVLERANFDPEKDRLICLGDVADGWPEVRECFEYLAALPNLIYILGNHDQGLMAWIEGRMPGWNWFGQGGAATIASFSMHPSHVSYRVKKLLFDRAKYYHIEEKDGILRCFVHGGFRKHPMLEEGHDLLWDRDLLFSAHAEWQHALQEGYEVPQLTEFDEIYVGHTSTEHFERTEPMHVCEVWAMDTGAGWSGKLSMMDIETKEVFQSDPAPELYPSVKGRA